MSEDETKPSQNCSPIFAEALLDSAVDENGESMYLVKWTDSWLSEKIVSKSFPKLLSIFKEENEPTVVDMSISNAAVAMLQLDQSQPKSVKSSDSMTKLEDEDIDYNDDDSSNDVSAGEEIIEKHHMQRNTIGTRSKVSIDAKKSSKVTKDPQEPCSYCGKLLTKRRMKIHVSQVHLQNGKFRCNKCGKRFFIKSLLKKHLTTSCEKLNTSSKVIQNEAKNVAIQMNSIIQSSLKKTNQKTPSFISTHTETSSIEVENMLQAVIAKSATSTSKVMSAGTNGAETIKFENVDESYSSKYLEALDLMTTVDFINIHTPADAIEALNLISSAHIITPNANLQEVDVTDNLPKLNETEQVPFYQKPKPRYARERSSKYDSPSNGDKLRVSCDICSKVMLRSQLKSHKKIIHSAQYPCTSCGNLYLRPCDLKKHQRHPCGHRKEIIKLQRKTEKLLAKKEAKPRIRDYAKVPCDICGKMLSKGRIKEHQTQVHFNNGQFPCEVCGKRFAKQAVLDYHMLIHGEKSLECEFCGKRFSQRASFQRHRRSHTVESNWMCDCCFKTFKFKFDLSKHCFEDHANIAENPLPCCVCKEMLKVPNSVYRHSVAHTGVKTHECEICNKKFKGQQVLQKHLRMHERIAQEGPGRRKSIFTRVYGEFKCDICGKDFTLKAMLTRHTNKHTESTAEEYQAKEGEREALRKEKKRQYKRQYKLRQKQKLQMLNVLGVDPSNPIVKSINFKNWIDTDGTETIVATTTGKLEESDLAVEHVMSDNSSDMVEQEVNVQQINLEDGYALLNLLRNSGSATGQDDVDFFAS